ncbi:MAG: sigma-70 family RNA polymerase sigma factor [Clostridia bacterium]|nr:sigma-70 family RNA polymerase sigma factor [Clostridia bacterium]
MTVKYLTDKGYIDIEVANEEEAKAVDEANRMEIAERNRRKYIYKQEYSLNDLIEKGVDFSDEKEEQDEAKSEIIWEMLSCLKDRQREILRLHFLEKKTYAEIGKELGIHPVNVCRQVERIREKMEKFLASNSEFGSIF